MIVIIITVVVIIIIITLVVVVLIILIIKIVVVELTFIYLYNNSSGNNNNSIGSCNNNNSRSNNNKVLVTVLISLHLMKTNTVRCLNMSASPITDAVALILQPQPLLRFSLIVVDRCWGQLPLNIGTVFRMGILHATSLLVWLYKMTCPRQ